jgi:endonuclease/exonuclease/phosphatase family metal-dependent hydrolase
MRRIHQLERLKAWSTSPSDILCLQEVNPLRRHLQEIAQATRLMGEGTLVNAGIKLANIGLPPLLEEGLAIFAGCEFSGAEFSDHVLSGRLCERTLSLGSKLKFGLSLQLGEQRKALLFESHWKGKKIAVVNLHLHHGPDVIAANLVRKTHELHELSKWIRPQLDRWDFTVVCGDFNSDPDSSCLNPLRSMGFEDAADMKEASAKVAPSPTWDPQFNPHIRNSLHLAPSTKIRNWDGTPHRFDRFYIRSKQSPLKLALSQLREPELSDHYGSVLEVNL